MRNILLLIGCTVLFFFSLYAFYFIKYITQSQFKVWQKICIFVACVINVFILNFSRKIETSIPWIYLAFFALLFIEFLLLFKENSLVLLGGAATFVFHALCTRAISSSILAIASSTSIYAIQESSAFRVLSLFMSFVLVVLVFRAYSKRWSKDSFKALYSNRHQLFLNSAIEFVLLIYQILCAFSYQLATKEIWFVIFHISGAVLGGIWHFILTNNTINYSIWINQSFKEDILNEQISRQLMHYEAYEKQFDGFRQFRTEYDRLIGDVRHNIAQGNITAARALLQQADVNVQQLESGHKRYCNNMLVDSILWDTACAAELKGVKFDAQIFLPEWLGLTELEYCRIFANLCSNAMEAVEAVKENPYISFSSSISGTWLTIVQKNPYKGSIMHTEGVLLTTKNDTERHGMGISSIRAVLEQHGGFGEISVDEQRRIFSFIIHMHKA